jgi:capsid protein
MSIWADFFFGGRVKALEAEVGKLREQAVSPREYYGPENGWGSSGPSIFGGQKSPGALGGIYGQIAGLDYQALRNRSRMAKWESTEAEGIVGRLVDNIIGTGLSVQATPIWELLEPKAKKKPAPDPADPDETVEDQDSDRRHAIKRDIEIRHNLYLNSTEPDATGTRSGYNLQAFEAETLFWDGEVFKVFRYSGDPNRMSPLYFQFYLADQVCQPGASEQAAAKARGNTICEGIEITSEGREIAIYVTEDPLLKPMAYIRIPFWSDDGKRRFVAHPKITDKPGQVRGVPLLANVLHELTKITDGKVAELEAMVLNALFAVWKKPSDKAPTGAAPGGIGRPTLNQSPSVGAPIRVDNSGNTQFLRPGVMFPNLRAGETLESFDTKRPNINVTEFMDRIMTNVAASKGLSFEMYQIKYNTSWVAARAAFQTAWVKILMWRDMIDTQTVGPEYRQWFTEEVAARRIKAPGFGKSPLLTEAWLSHKLLGASMPVLNPVQEVLAIEKRMELGHTTGEAEAMIYNNSDFTENVARQKVENEDLAEARAPLMVATGDTNAAPGAPVQGALDFGDAPEQGKDPTAPGYQPKMDPNSDQYDENYTPEAA